MHGIQRILICPRGQRNFINKLVEVHACSAGQIEHRLVSSQILLRQAEILPLGSRAGDGTDHFVRSAGKGRIESLIGLQTYVLLNRQVFLKDGSHQLRSHCDYRGALFTFGRGDVDGWYFNIVCFGKTPDCRQVRIQVLEILLQIVKRQILDEYRFEFFV